MLDSEFNIFVLGVQVVVEGLYILWFTEVNGTLSVYRRYMGGLK